MSKVLSLPEAIARYVHTGSTVCLAGLSHLIPYAAGHEIIRQGISDLVIIRTAPDLLVEQMVTAGIVRKVVFSWAGNPGVGLLRVFRRFVEAERIDIEEYTHFGLVAALIAGAMGLPFFPLRSMGGDLARVNDRIREIKDPYSGETLYTVPALQPDVTIIHAQRSDSEGNVHVWGMTGEQKEAAFAAKSVIVTAEELVDSSVIKSDPNRILIPGFKVDAVVHVPWGAYPSYALGFYDRDNEFYFNWPSLARDEDALRAWLAEYVTSTRDHADFLDKLGGEQVTARLRVGQRLSTPVSYGVHGGDQA